MEWIEVTGETLESAKEHALKMLGIEENEAEFIVLEEPKSGIFRIKKSSARIRARIKPRRPDFKKPNRNRRKQGPSKRTGQKKPNNNQSRKNQSNRNRKSTSTNQNKKESRRENTREKMTSNDIEQKPLMEQSLQEETLTTFFEGLLEAWGLTATIEYSWPRDYICEVSLKGDDLDALIGYNAETLQSLENIATISLKKKAEDTRYAQVRLDVAGFRAKREEALVEFVKKLAEEVKEEGKPKILEPMDNRDRKIVHDALNDVNGISTVSEGQNPERRVKIVPTETE